jgi:hypothetical protein
VQLLMLAGVEIVEANGELADGIGIATALVYATDVGDHRIFYIFQIEPFFGQ